LTVTKLLIDRGAKVDHTDFEMCTPLHLAVHNKRFAVAEVLMAAGARTDIRINECQRTALEMAQDYYNDGDEAKFPATMERAKKKRETGGRNGYVSQQ
jgi:hypothetical protein